MNPPRHARRRRRRASRKQLAALKKARAALHKIRNPKRRRSHAHRKAARRRRRSRQTHKNPIGIGEIAIMANPKHRRHRRSHRRSRRHRRSRGMRLFRNPLGGTLSAVTSAPREVIKADFLKDAVAVSIGFIGTAQLLPRLPVAMINTRVKAYGSKALITAVGSAIASKVSGSRAARMVLLGGALNLALDLWTDFVSPMIAARTAAAPAAGAPGVQHFFGERHGVDHYFGDGGMSDANAIAYSPAEAFS